MSARWLVTIHEAAQGLGLRRIKNSPAEYKGSCPSCDTGNDRFTLIEGRKTQIVDWCRHCTPKERLDKFIALGYVQGINKK